jgi:hypothetical protein
MKMRESSYDPLVNVYLVMFVFCSICQLLCIHCYFFLVLVCSLLAKSTITYLHALYFIDIMMISYVLDTLHVFLAD